MRRTTGNGSEPVLVAYDGSAAARAAIAQSARLFPSRPTVVMTACQSVAAATPAALIAVPAGVAHAAETRLDAESARHAEELAQEGAALAREAGLDACPAAVTVSGPVWPAIIRMAEEKDAAVVGMGSRGRSTLTEAVLGSVSSGVVHHCRRPLMIVHGSTPRSH
jgi:nucleotide-binding universal stress UspA family protein